MNGKPGCDRGFTYIAVLILVVVASIALMGAAKYWRTVIKREKEAQLLFNGDQIRKAIESYVNAKPSEKGKPEYPARLEDLLLDPRFMSVHRYLRKIYPDPFSEDGKWKIIRKAGGKIGGVFSGSKEKPLKTANFPKPYEGFENAGSYSEWRFEYHFKNKNIKSPASEKKEEKK